MSNTKNYTEQGGAKTVIGGELTIATGGKLTFGAVEAKPAANQVASTATDVAGLKTDLNALLTKLKAAGLMVADS